MSPQGEPVPRWRQPRRFLRLLLPVSVVLLGCFGLPLGWLQHQRMHERPELIYPHYSQELDAYGRRLEVGDVLYVEGRGYAIPQFLIDKGAKWIVRQGDCYVVVFNSFLDNPTPELWYCPGGFDPMPAAAGKVATDPKARWQQLAPRWAARYNP